MKRVCAAAAVGAFVAVNAACAAETDADECRILGTYTMTATPETQSAGCSAISGNEGDTGSTTVTISSVGTDYVIELQGAQGACKGSLVESCKLQSKCDYVVTDALDSADDTGTLQFSWTFDASGFRGVNSARIPKATSVPEGCSFTSNATATRR